MRALSAGGVEGVQSGLKRDPNYARPWHRQCLPVAAGLALTLAAAIPSRPAHAQALDETVLLPFTCQIERGRIAVTPASERSYKIMGPRTSHAFTACRPNQPDQCRTWQLHKFDLMCGGSRVSWLAVVAASLDRTPGRGRVEGGRLNLRMSPAWRGAGVLTPMLAFPPGYAPALGLGARFTGGHAPPPTVVDARPLAPKVAKTTDAAFIARSEGQAPTEPASGSSKSGSGRWQTTVQPELATQWQPSLWRALGGLVLVLAAWGLLIATRSRWQTAAAATATEVSGAPDGDDAALCAELIARAVNVHRASRDALAAVASDNLRLILADDLATIQRTLLSPALTADVADSRWPAVKPIVMTALADLERVARIIADVLASAAPPIGRGAPAPPQSAAEAFEVLGINPDASRTVIKKVVDGLRQSWHPDHARNDNDRAAREERLKQINVAWDLIRRDRATEPTAA